MSGKVGNGHMTDPVWNEYVESVRHLTRLPELMDERRRQTNEDEEIAARRAQTALDAALARCEEWRMMGKRAIANSEARLVAAKVLVPDASGAPTVSYDTPEPLAEDIGKLTDELDTALAKLEEARRRTRLDAAEQAAREIRQAERQKQLVRYGATAALVIAFLIVAALLLP